MKYLTEIKGILRMICDNKSGYEISVDEWEDMELEIVKSHPGIYTQLMSDIEVGIKNGYTLEQQINIVKKLLLK